MVSKGSSSTLLNWMKTRPPWQPVGLLGCGTRVFCRHHRQTWCTWHGAVGRRGGQLGPGGHREAIRNGSRIGKEAQRRCECRLFRGSDISDRSLSRQRNGAEHSVLSFREWNLRADLESELRRAGRDYHCGNGGCRGTGTIL